jgi:endoglucanase
VIDLHALPGYQNHHWHSDNPTHRAMFWEHPHFQDRVVHLWEAIADRYKAERWVAGYNLINEPADESRAVVGPFSQRLSAAVRAVGPHHTLFLDGNTYATESGTFDEPLDNAVYTLHDYVPAGLGRGGHYPGETVGVWIDRDHRVTCWTGCMSDRSRRRSDRAAPADWWSPRSGDSPSSTRVARYIGCRISGLIPAYG